MSGRYANKQNIVAVPCDGWKVINRSEDFRKKKIPPNLNWFLVFCCEWLGISLYHLSNGFIIYVLKVCALKTDNEFKKCIFLKKITLEIITKYHKSLHKNKNIDFSKMKSIILKIFEFRLLYWVHWKVLSIFEHRHYCWKIWRIF